jgi:hypothetical protein
MNKIQKTKRVNFMKVNVNGPSGYITLQFEHYAYRTISDYTKNMDNYATLSARELMNKKPVSCFFSLLISPVFVFFKMFFF